MAIAPELLFQILALASDAHEPRALNLQVQRRGLQVAVFSVEVIAGRGVADKGSVHCCGCSENFSGRKIRPVPRADQTAGLHPVEPTIEMRGDFRSGFGFYSEGFGAKHALAQLLAEAIHQAVIRAHALLHDLWRDSDHVRVTNLAALHHSYDGHARTKLARLWGHAEHADVRGFQGFQHYCWRNLHRPRSKLFKK